MSKAIVGKSYRHYKGSEYQVIGLGLHTETGEEFVIYKASMNDTQTEKFWLRPRKMFEEKVMVEGVHVDRFSLVE